MRSRAALALLVGTDLVGGILAGLLLGAGFDWAMEHWAGVKTGPWGLMVFFLLGVVAGFKNAYEDLKRLERLPSEEGEGKADEVLDDGEEGGGEGRKGREEL
ncbi:MAG: AtpZ/AtpI family protein [Aquificae bacterium]|nr:AtpZ/AtpI family protein [Aquificota bacterium]